MAQTKKAIKGKSVGGIAKKKTSPKKVNSEYTSLFIIVGGLIWGALLYIPSGLIGPNIKSFFLGLFGFPVFLFPILMVINGVHMASNKKYEENIKKYYIAAAGILILSAIFTLLSLTPKNPLTSISEYWDYGKNGYGGGVFGGILCDIFANTLGSVIAGIILFTLLTVIIMILTKWSPIKALLRTILRAYIKAKHTKNAVKEQINTLDREYEAEELQAPKKKQRMKIYNDEDITPKSPADEMDIIKRPYDDEEYLPPSLRNIESSDEPNIDNIDEIVNTAVGGLLNNNGDALLDASNKTSSDDLVKEDIKSSQNACEYKEESFVEDDIEALTDEIEQAFERIPYTFPDVDLLNDPSGLENSETSRLELKETAQKLILTLKSFNVDAKLINVCKGPTVTRYELKPGDGVKVSKIVGLSDDIALRLAASGVRIEAPIPNKEAIGIEIPNKTVDTVFVKDVIGSDEFKAFKSSLAFALGKDITGKNVVVDLGKMPHLLIAGATGSGKSVCINTLIASLIYKSDPNEVKLLMVDPKVVELGIYNGIPHLLIPVVTDPRRASGALYWAVQEMLKRYTLFADSNVRDIKGYNEMLREQGNENTLPHIVIIIDELADLMMVAPGEVEDSICRLAQMARAAGMHLVIATQRPSVDVITGIIKANIPSRIAFSVSSQVDSRTILDSSGAEKLLGRGDMLFSPVGSSKPIRLQGAFISDKEVERIVDFIKGGSIARYDEDIIEKIENGKAVNINESNSSDDSDELLPRAIEIAVDTGKISASYIQRRLKVGFSRAARIVDQMEARGLIGPPDGSKPREVLISKDDYLEMSINT